MKQKNSSEVEPRKTWAYQPSGSWDAPCSPVIFKDVLVFGPNGSGYEAIMNKMPDGYSYTIPGFRASSMYPEQWEADLPAIWWEMTQPWNYPRMMSGFGCNFEALISLPWSAVCMIQVSEDTLRKRVLEYRSKKQYGTGGTGVRDGLRDEEVMEFFLEQRKSMESIFQHCSAWMQDLHERKRFIRLDGEKSLDELVDEVCHLLKTARPITLYAKNDPALQIRDKRYKQSLRSS